MKYINQVRNKLLILISVITLSSTVYAGIPVIDIGSIAKSIQQIEKLNKQIEKQTAMVNNLKDKLKLAKKEFDLNNIATDGFANFYPNAMEELHSFLPENPMNIKSLLETGGGNDKIKDEIVNIRETLEAFSPSDIFKDTTTKVSNEYKKEGDFLYSQMAINQTVYKKTETRKAKLDAYRENLKGADTPKKTMDLLVRINIENAFLMNEIISMQAMKNQTDLLHMSNKRNAEARRRVINTTADDIKLN